MKYFSKINQPITIQVIDTQGKILIELKRNASIGEQEFSLDFKDKLPSGNYFVKILEDANFGLHQINKLAK